MRLAKFRYTTLGASLLGFFLPVAIMIGLELRLFSTPAGDWLLYVWPSSIMLTATETLGHSPKAFAILAWSIGWNMLLCLIVFTFIWSAVWVLRAWRASLRDETTI